MPFGATVLPAGGVRFRLWAPDVAEPLLEWEPAGADTGFEVRAMRRLPEGWHETTMLQAQAGDRYRFVVGDGLRVPDPASRWNPDDVHGASRVLDPLDHLWRDDGWQGRPWEEAVVYELHVGTFTPEGTFAAATARLGALAELGVTAIELMPLADFPGQRNWGYDGVLPFAPDAAYGTPADLKAFVETAHRFGLMVLIDVVYNHFGPEGNYLHAYCPSFFNPSHQTPWGAAINFDGERSRAVRDFFIHNAVYWIEEYRFDGLRMDAIHAIRDDSPLHIVDEIGAALRSGPGGSRHIHVVLENDANQARFLERDPGTRPWAGTAQWNDDLHHAAHVLVTGETDGYYVDYAVAPIEQFGRALAEGFLYTGQPSSFRGGEPRGEPAGSLPLTAFVSFLQTHDQVGNRAFGERIGALADPQLLRAAHAGVLLSPHVPMLFMGEEYAASTPFLYFCDFGPELAEAVSRGRRAEFARFAAFADESARAKIPDPNAESTFRDSQLQWDERDVGSHRWTLEATRQLLAVRRREIVPRLAGQRGPGEWRCDGDTLLLCWSLDGGAARLHLIAHFGAAASTVTAPPGRLIHASDAAIVAAGLLVLQRGGVWATLEETPIDG
ncbi:MAG: malto-oligosyltrehalose trehalohydrolase [Burkholderiales bacterium]|nr:malto-oligosyltrehalose trehalohydrolase [Burkholderiales bacterium]